MTINAQFLFFYIDELIQHHWVDWMEGPLSNVPLVENRDSRGFQKTLGDLGAGPRTRAGEAYKLGLLTGRIVKPQVSGVRIPSGWQEVIDGQLPSTRLGDYAYIIGKALRSAPDNADLQKALDCLACIQILHIGFKIEDRWYCTALLYRYALKQFEAIKGEAAYDDEKRYLAAAVINTLESDRIALLLEPYKSNNEISSLIFELTDTGSFEFKLSELPKIVADKTVGINDFNKTKAALFWSQSFRGIYARASRSPGAGVLDELISVDQKLAAAGQQSLLAITLEAIEENADFKEAPKVWFDAQKLIRGDEPTIIGLDGAKEEAAAPDLPADEGASKPKNKLIEKITVTLPTLDALGTYMDEKLDGILVDVPESSPAKKRSPSVPRVTKTDYAERDSRNRKLGEAGEQFVLEYEKRKLRAAGQTELAEKVVWASKDVGDGLGYDIKSYSETGEELLIEVKTTAGGSATPFYLSNNEVSVSREKAELYRLYRVFDFTGSPKLFVLFGSLEETLTLEATSFRARIS